MDKLTKKKSFLLVACSLFLLSIFNPIAQGADMEAYPNGAEAFMVGAAPPPGLTYVNYMYFYSANEFKESNGDDSKLLDSLTVYAEVARFIWISKKRFFGANYGQHFFLTLLDANMEFNKPVGPKGGRNYHDTDIPYFIWSPFLLTWHLMDGKLHTVLDIADIYIPLFNEDNNNFVSLGRNYWTIEPVFAVTYMPSPAWEFSAKFMYDFNTRQEDYSPGPPVKIDRTPGQEFHMDFNCSYGLNPNLRIGVSGYYYRQVKNDDFHGIDELPAPLQTVVKGLEGEQGQVWALGPGVWYKRGKIIATLRSQWEFEAKNHPEGYNVWFKLIYPF